MGVRRQAAGDRCDAAQGNHFASVTHRRQKSADRKQKQKNFCFFTISWNEKTNVGAWHWVYSRLWRLLCSGGASSFHSRHSFCWRLLPDWPILRWASGPWTRPLLSVPHKKLGRRYRICFSDIGHVMGCTGTNPHRQATCKPKSPALRPTNNLENKHNKNTKKKKGKKYRPKRMGP